MPDALLRLGFGFVEIGTVTPRPQPGNPKPAPLPARSRRRADQSHGVQQRRARRSSSARLGRAPARSRHRRRQCRQEPRQRRRRWPITSRGCAALRRLPIISSSTCRRPNTPGLRDLQRAMCSKRCCASWSRRATTRRRPPLLVKIAPDLTEEERADIAAVALAAGIDGIIVSTPPSRGRRACAARRRAKPAGSAASRCSSHRRRCSRDIYRLTEGRLPLIGVGGVASAEDAYAKIRAGASLVQLYTALVFAGPGLLGRDQERPRRPAAPRRLCLDRRGGRRRPCASLRQSRSAIQRRIMTIPTVISGMRELAPAITTASSSICGASCMTASRRFPACSTAWGG